MVANGVASGEALRSAGESIWVRSQVTWTFEPVRLSVTLSRAARDEPSVVSLQYPAKPHTMSENCTGLLIIAHDFAQQWFS
jgi:hypothetical protein